MKDYSKLRCRFIKKEEIRNTSEEFRNTYWKSSLIPIDMESIIESGLHIDIIPHHGIRQLNNVDAYLKSNLTGIVVDITQYMDPQGRYDDRLRFSFAHEIGHFVLHKYIYQEFSIDFRVAAGRIGLAGAGVLRYVRVRGAFLQPQLADVFPSDFAPSIYFPWEKYDKDELTDTISFE